MSEISETEIKSMTKEQNYMRGYKDGKSDVLDKIRAEIEAEEMIETTSEREFYNMALNDVLQIIDKYTTKENDCNTCGNITHIYNCATCIGGNHYVRKDKE